MRTRITATLLLAAAACCGQAIVYLRSTTVSIPPITLGASPTPLATQTSGTAVSSGTFNIAAGSLLICSVKHTVTGATITSVIDTGSVNTFAFAAGGNDGTRAAATYYKYNATSNTGAAVTFTFSASVDYSKVICDQFSGIKVSADPKDTSAYATVNTPAASAAYTTTFANTLLYSYMAGNNNTGVWTPAACGSGGNCTLLSSGTDPGDGSSMYRIVSAIQTAQTNNASVSAGFYNMMITTTFKGQ